jgi:DNA-binding transcriptional LysR family regulator
VIDVRRLRTLREVADRGTVAAAADALHLTPSAVSQQLAALAADAGAPVVERAGRGVRLTPAAEVLLRHADTLLAQVERLHVDLDAERRGELGELRVAGFATSLRGLVAPAAARLRETAPGVRLRIVEAEAPEAQRALAGHDVDVMVSFESAGSPQPRDPRYHREELLADILDAALPEDHPLAAHDELDLRELAADPWVRPPVGWACDEVVQAACRNAGFTPAATHRSGDWMTSLALVGAGLGVALVPRLAHISPPPGVVVRPLAGPPPCRHIFAVCRRGAEGRPALRALLDGLAEAAAVAGGALAAGPARAAVRAS